MGYLFTLYCQNLINFLPNKLGVSMHLPPPYSRLLGSLYRKRWLHYVGNPFISSICFFFHWEVKGRSFNFPAFMYYDLTHLSMVMLTLCVCFLEQSWGVSIFWVKLYIDSLIIMKGTFESTKKHKPVKRIVFALSFSFDFNRQNTLKQNLQFSSLGMTGGYFTCQRIVSPQPSIVPL